ncbi:hypothetical protein ASPZODRAFT_17207 [Penicilliopsis zonata CBS 506.65]|uniref:C2H2 type master regulator of conidiophore development brlA n=1 Tax=Penicilliopsis zonata CBS 506.65 TaxID=1073090 RepID=A0A1L9SEZ3_9EURO|nr:hypothetical protein ASPZODRAFT_17207 [Penicilliopsis zonata CBS 506.65]OJJ45766.1 hypothetical protein ASPZODRAFT_17207 [Penicilliopsis zonata CBS 506.65]
MADRLAVDVECPPLSGCPSITSNYSPMESPTPTPTSLYSQGSLASPGWHEGASFAGHPYERHTASTPLRSSFRLADVTNDGTGMPVANMDLPERMPLPDYMSGYDENVEQFWIPSDMPKTYDPQASFPSQGGMMPYPQMARNYYRQHPPATYLPESASNPCLSRPMFNQPERIPNSVSMSNILQWMPTAESMPPQTITPSQAFHQAPVTPPPSYSEFHTSLNAFKNQTPTTPIRSGSLGTPSGTDTPMSRLSGGATDYHDEFGHLSPAYRDGYLQRPPPQRQPSGRKVIRKQSSKHSMTLESLPSIIKQVQFKCKEPGCPGRFKRQEHLKRHMKSHSKEKPHICWVPGCHRAFSRSDNLNAHYTKTHSKRGGRNRYVATLDQTSPDYNPDFRGQLTQDGRPIYGSKLEDPILDDREMSVDYDE